MLGWTVTAKARSTRRTCQTGTEALMWMRVLSLWFFGAAGLIWAQTDRGTITGSVTDPSGAVIVGAKVTATNTATRASTETITTSTGKYTVPLLRPGTYEVTVEQTGFKKYIQTGVIVEVGQTV